MEKTIKFLSHFKIFVAVYGLCMLGGCVLTWSRDVLGVYDMFGFHIPPETLQQMGWGQRLFGFLVDTIDFAFLGVVLICLYKLLEAFERREVFSNYVISLLERMARFYLFLVLFTPLQKSLMSVITSYHLGEGNRVITVSFGSDNLNQIFLAGCMYLVLYLMKEAYEVAFEQKMVI